MLTVESCPGLGEILAALCVDAIRAEQLVKWGQDALEAGYDTPSTLALAIADPPYFTPDTLLLFEQALAENGGVEPLTCDQLRVFQAQSVVRNLLAEGASPRAIAERMAALCPLLDSPPPLNMWWQLDEAFVCEYCREVLVQSDETLEEVVLRHASALSMLDWRAA